MHPKVEQQLMERNREAQREFIARMRAELRGDWLVSQQGVMDEAAHETTGVVVEDAVKEHPPGEPREPGKSPNGSERPASRQRGRIDTFMDRLVRQRRRGA